MTNLQMKSGAQGPGSPLPVLVLHGARPSL